MFLQWLLLIIFQGCNSFRLKREISNEICSQTGNPCQVDLAKFGRSFWISAVNTQQDGDKPTTTASGTARVSVGLDFQPSFCGLRPFVSSAQAPSMRIVGGKEAEKGRFPYQAQIWFQSSPGSESFFQCGGTLISHHIVLSAGHCFKVLNPSQYTIALGKQLIGPINTECQEQVFGVSRIEVHPRFNARQLTNDIALVWIKSKYNQSAFFNDFVQPACLPDMEADPREFYSQGKTGTVSGWGLLNETGLQGSQTMQYVSLPILADDACTKAYGQMVTFDTSLQFCAGNNLGQDACSGDSGGPFVADFNGRATLIGAVSYGKGCARADFPGVYTKVHSYLPWVLSKVVELNGTTSEVLVTSVTLAPATTISTTTRTTTTTTTSTSTTTTTTSTTTTTTSTTTTRITTTISARTTKAPIMLDGMDSIASVSVPESATPPSALLNSLVVGPVCKNSFKLLSCIAPRTINIVYTFYGRQSQQYCPDELFGQFTQQRAASGSEVCSLDKAEIYLKYLCDRRTSCWVYNELFVTDPCPGVSKYAFVYYTCQ